MANNKTFYNLVVDNERIGAKNCGSGLASQRHRPARCHRGGRHRGRSLQRHQFRGAQPHYQVHHPLRCACHGNCHQRKFPRDCALLRHCVCAQRPLLRVSLLLQYEVNRIAVSCFRLSKAST